MISRRLIAAVAVQLAAGAALMAPVAAEWGPWYGCIEEIEGRRECVPKDPPIWWGPDDYTVITDGFVCSDVGSGYDWELAEFWSEDTDEDGLEDAQNLVDDECDDWAAGSGGGSGSL